MKVILVLALALSLTACQSRSRKVDVQNPGTVGDQVPRETPREFLPHLTEMELPGCRFPSENGTYVHVTQFVKPWQPYPSTLFGAWRAVVEQIPYDDHKLYTRWYAQTPEFTWRHKRGICIDTAILLCAWLLKQGENAFVGLGDTGEVRLGHAWVVVRDSRRRETLLFETAIDAALPPSNVRALPPAEEYRIHALFNDKHIFVADEYKSEFEQYLRVP